ncbi:MAG: sulfite oxidase heme-binding subunit YedZ [Gemmatimonadales bacterium]
MALGLVPLACLVADGFGDRLGANPIEEITHRTGDWTIRFLLAALAVTPLRRLTGWNRLIRFRRTIGLLAFSYASVHFLTYVGLDQGLALTYVGEDIAKRPYITVGFAAFLLLIPLAVTSTQGWIRRLGGRRWNALHRVIYVAAAGGVLHYLWLVKGDQVTPVYYAVALVLLLALRVRRPRIAAAARPAEPPRPAAVRTSPYAVPE